MISRKQLLNKPEKYQPLSSLKSIRNANSIPDYSQVDLRSMFLNLENRQLLAKSLYSAGSKIGKTADLTVYIKLVNKTIFDFDKKNPVNKFINVDIEATGNHNWVEMLRVANNEYLKHCYDYLKWDDFNPYRATVEVGNSQNRHRILMRDVLAHDIPTIDVYASQEVARLNKNYRYDNKIPVWQHSMHRRHYDTCNEGLREHDAYRASLDNPIYTMDMDQIKNNLDDWKREEWFGL